MCHLPKIRLAALLFFALKIQSLAAQHSVAREWSEALLQTMREDLARPAVQARNIYHFSLALYDAWAAYDDEARTYLLGKTAEGFDCPCSGVPLPGDKEAARKEAMSFAAYRLLTTRFTHSPEGTGAVYRFRELMQKHGYDFRNHSYDYSSGSPAALGNYIAHCILKMGQLDGANEANNYLGQDYPPMNPPLEVIAPGPGKLQDPNHWQPLQLNYPIDLDGYPMTDCKCGGRPLSTLIGSVDGRGRKITNIQTLQVPTWGQVKPFALKMHDLKVYRLEGREYRLYYDPGNDYFPRLDTAKGGGTSQDYMWNFALVAAWSAFLDPNDGTLWEVSPRSMGNVQRYPRNLAELRDFYDLKTGRDPGAGHEINPRTSQPYAPQTVPRGDFIRVVVQYWAEGPAKETPPGHWLTLLNYVSDQPGLVKKFNGKGRVMSDLEWDVKAYFLLGGALHDAAIAAWGIKGLYDGVRPITALRYMATLGQSTDPKQPSYHPAGIPLLPGRIELVKKGDPLAGAKNEHLGKIRLYAWKGPFAVKDSTADIAGVGWTLAENWYPYQPKSFITPPYPGFVSGHAAFSHSAAEALTLLTGDAYFPGGLGEFTVKANSRLLRFEKGPGMDVTLQWATYRDAADQASLSRVWGGSNAPFDDIPGRMIGARVGAEAFHLAKSYFYKDSDGDGYLSNEDCDDNNPAMYPGAEERCDGVDNDCNGKADDAAPCGGARQ
ncbi:MAG: hypothetical protein EPGJADBJ_02953 [Saprospiraceae bacterium]|nr:hypothetical protein [Saprospiraceae bacterium]